MAISFAFLYNNNLYSGEIDYGKEVKFGSHKKDDIHIDSLCNSQIIIKWKSSGLSVMTKSPFSVNLKDAPLETMIKLCDTADAVLYFVNSSGISQKTLKLPYNCILNIGRKSKNDIVIDLPFMSGEHFVIKSESGNVRVEDKNSTNGLFVNGRRVTVAKLRSEDIVSIMTVRIKLVKGVLYFENVFDRLEIKHMQLDSALDNSVGNNMTDNLIYKRSPRTQEELPSDDIILANPPSKGQKYEKSRGLFASVAGTSAMMASSMFMGAASPALLAARAATLVSPISSIVSSKDNNKRRKKKSEEYERMRLQKYGAYIEDQKSKIESVASVQREIISRENPDVAECQEILYGLKRNLWERVAGDRDFLDVRIGMGYENLCVNVKSRADVNGFQMEDDEVKELSERIIEETRIVDNVPKRISLREQNTIGIIGDRQKVNRLVKNIIVSLTSLHCFEEVRLVGIFDKSEREYWDSIKWVPHIWDDNKQFRFLAFDKEDTHNICDLFSDILKKRKDSLQDSFYTKSPVPIPYYIFIFGSKELVEKEKIMSELFVNRPEMGITSLFLFNDMYSLPHDCRFIIDVDNGPCGFEKDKVNEKFFFTMDVGLNDMQFDAFARFMSAVKLKGFVTESPLPNGITFLQGYGCESVNNLNITERWRNSTPFKSLAAPIGAMTGGKIFSLDIHEKAHGPHGLVAGTTGSGKSELLQTWILSMAVNYHPHDVNFVIIDYKGGGMANLLEPLPHVVGKITNIGANISRSLVSLQCEIKRRQQIFDKYGVNHIDKYQKMYKMGNVDEPLPRLIIVADEFAELKKSEPEFMAGLISTSRVGRSLGVHLVLATQKPGGVVDDQIQSNSRFRLCLKVQDVSDSREMIKRPDAAKITQAGRSFVRVGEDEYFDLFQSFWSGAPYFGSISKNENVGNQVRYVEINGQRVKTFTDEKTRFKSDVDELEAVVKYVVSVAKKNSIKPLSGPWLPELPDILELDSLLKDGFDGENWNSSRKWLSVPVGLYDAPALQEQGELCFDFVSEGHYGIYGSPSTGKTNLLKTIVLSLCRVYTPDDVNIYIIDCGGWGMSMFSNMPHVGGVVLDCEEEKLLKLEKLILDEIEERKRKFYENGISALESYKETVGNDIPAIVIVVDNIISMFDLYPDIENTFITISRDGAKYGVYLVYTASNTTGVRYKVMQNIKGAVAFELNDKGDYATVVGKLDGMSLPKIVGRGFYKGTPPLEFQAALYADGDNEKEKTDYIKKLSVQMNAAWKGSKARPIPVMPDKISFEKALSEYAIRTMIPVGFNYENISMSYINLEDNYSLVVTGSIGTGKSKTLSDMADMILNKFPESKIFVFDGLRKSLAGLNERVYKYAPADSDERVTEMLEEIIEHLNTRKRAQNKARQADADSFDEKQFISNYEMIAVIIDDLKEYVDSVSEANKNSMERICRLAQNLGVIVITAGRISDLLRYNEIESLTRVIIGNQNGLALSDTPATFSYFQNNLKYNEKDVPAGDGNGFIFNNGKCLRVKLIG